VITRDGEKQEMKYYFKQRDPEVFNRNNAATVNSVLRRSIDEFKVEREAWSQRGSGRVVEVVLEAFVNVAQYQPFRGGRYMPLPKKLQNKKAIINVQNRDNQCLRLALRAALFPPKDGMNVSWPSRYPTEDGLNFTGIDFPVSQINKLEKQNPHLAINVFGWEKERVIVDRLSEKEGSLPRINLMLIQNNEKSHYTFVRRLNALLYDQSRHNSS